MRPALPLESLWAFHLIAETGSLTAAAASLGVTQPAVSKRLRDLETLLGCALVRRGANAISLTESGRRFAEELGDGFAKLQAATQRLKSDPRPLRIRAYTTWALRWLIPRLPGFRQNHPGIEVEVSTSTAAVDLVREGVDAAVSTAPRDRPPSPGARQLQPMAVAPFAIPPLAGSWRPDRPEHPLLGSKVRPHDWPMWLRANGIEGEAKPLLFESTTLAIQAALEGLGTVICAPGYVRGEVGAGRLVGLSGQVLQTQECYWLILPNGRIDGPLKTFADWLVREAFAEAAGQMRSPEAPGTDTGQK
ncbi:LysR substrate-binding domain-containing protein [Roseomonas xinghualingensis]|uniref:LysR substrate-binding domain-containing protein n=1 Tax=Roseomonas xinghualingensis TaxID=2986475 RepID=UPI0021F1E222|nr:LysR substrate-binding domain-containing protein [Roseomonas sp. SXEYE001]MCV4209959.1 LysR substrate-binding domain-containing protein [Roseomonas sp. SXEYE001]